MTDLIDNPQGEDTPEKLLHDIATPLLIAQMNADLLVKHLPQMIAVLQNLSPNNAPLFSDEKVIAALSNAPTAIKNNISTLQKKIRDLSNLLENHNVAANKANIPSPKRHLDNNTQTSSANLIKNILLVEDETIHQDIGLNLLSPFYQVDCANNGLEAIRRCKQKHYDLILMDLQMPKMNGVEATTELRKIISADVMIIGLTSMPIGSKRNELLDLGFNNFLEKPLKLENFQNILRLHVNND